jgi:hypothetical protein
MTGLAVLVITVTVALAARPEHPRVDEVTVHNAGFSDAKLDDCQQGFQPACDWLKTTK